VSKKWTVRDIPAQTGKIALVTGANSGLGLETTIGLAGAGALVIMACRNPAKAEYAVAEVRRRVPNAQIAVMPLDLADLSSIRRFASAFSNQYPCLDILCNNAGVMALPFQKTRDGFEMQIGTNHLGPFALTGLLLDRLKAATEARIVNVASVAHKTTPGLELDNLHWERGPYKKADAYGKSKLANLLFTFELNQRLRRAQVSIIAAAAHPGYSATGIGDGATQGSFFAGLAMRSGNFLFAQSAEKGALPTLYAATMPDVQGGDYIGPHGLLEFAGYPVKVGCRPTARDPQVAAALWALSEKLTDTQYL
jgi:NAD(P)-dependent dehydrogenase (short-subunit alcohol dehydrogenase family)